MPSPWLGSSYALNDKQQSVQRTVNLIPKPLEPGNERTDWILEDVPGLKPFNTTIVTPPAPPFFLLHFDVDPLIESAHGTLFDHADSTTPNDFSLTTSAKFGANAGRWTGVYGWVQSTNAYPGTTLSLNQTPFQIEGWIKFVSASASSTVLSLTSFTTAGATWGGPGGDYKQLTVNVLNTGEMQCNYAPASGTASVLMTRVGSAFLLPVGTWTHWAIVFDATSARMYVNGTKTGEVVGGALPAAPFTNQRIFIGTDYVGGIPPLQIYAQSIHADMDEMRGLLYVTYTGSTIVVPTGPFLPP